jgi:hypothetical protein
MVMKSRRLMLPPAMETAECDSHSLALFDRLARKKPEAFATEPGGPACQLMSASPPKAIKRCLAAK